MGKQLRSKRHKALMQEIAAARQGANMSQRDLAKALGREHSFVGKIESGERRLNVLEFCEVADALGENAAELLRKIL